MPQDHEYELGIELGIELGLEIEPQLGLHVGRCRATVNNIGRDRVTVSDRVRVDSHS